MNSVKIMMLMVAALAAFTACSDDANTSTVTATGEDIQGTWALSCTVFGSTSSFTSSVTFSSGTSTFTINKWADETGCSGTSHWVENSTATISFVDTTTASNGETVSRFNSTETVATLTPNTDSGTFNRNFNVSYGISDWATGVTRNILGLDNTTGAVISTSEMNIIRVNTFVSPNTIQFGVEVGDGGSRDADGYLNDLDTTALSKS